MKPSGPLLIDDAFGKFPDHMQLVPDVFVFSHDNILDILSRFKNNSDVMIAFDALTEIILSSDLPEDEKNNIIDLLNEEREIINFSEIARGSVLAI